MITPRRRRRSRLDGRDVVVVITTGRIVGEIAIPDTTTDGATGKRLQVRFIHLPFRRCDKDVIGIINIKMVDMDDEFPYRCNDTNDGCSFEKSAAMGFDHGDTQLL
jgi:hypothetical protein